MKRCLVSASYHYCLSFFCVPQFRVCPTNEKHRKHELFSSLQATRVYILCIYLVIFLFSLRAVPSSVGTTSLPFTLALSALCQFWVAKVWMIHTSTRFVGCAQHGCARIKFVSCVEHSFRAHKSIHTVKLPDHFVYCSDSRKNNNASALRFICS